MTPEHRRLEDARERGVPWRRWGPYLSERQWGTVREDYSAQGDAWSYFPHDHARSRAYRWGEDGLAGVSDDGQRLCLALGPWNGHDPIGGARKFQEDPRWRDHLLFYEYFHGDDGAGIGASHQTGWTGLVAQLMRLMALASPELLLREGLEGAARVLQAGRRRPA